MSQYKAAMERMNADDSLEGSQEDPLMIQHLIAPDGDSDIPPSGKNDSPSESPSPPPSSTPPPSPILGLLERHASLLLMPTAPLLWCALFLCTMDRRSILESWGMPILGIGSATLANAVPVGGGIVFVPMLALFGVHIQLGAAFAVATMTFGNGVFGLLSWLRKDPRALYDAWHVVPYAVLPAWVGAFVGIMRPLMSPERCRTLFASFAVAVAALVWRGLRLRRASEDAGGGMKLFTLSDCGDDDVGAAESAKQQPSARAIASTCSFLAGLVLVAHIGIGNAMMTFLVSTYVWKLPAKSAIVVSIVVGGWTSSVPFLLHLLVLRDVPVALWVMGLPGVYLGARVAPALHERIGIVNVLTAFVMFLLTTALLMVTTYK